MVRGCQRPKKGLLGACGKVLRFGRRKNVNDSPERTGPPQLPNDPIESGGTALRPADVVVGPPRTLKGRGAVDKLFLMQRLAAVPKGRDQRGCEASAGDAGEVRHAARQRDAVGRDAVEGDGDERHEEHAHRQALQRHGSANTRKLASGV